jgi:peptide/nickel transport system permease protein
VSSVLAGDADPAPLISRGYWRRSFRRLRRDRIAILALLVFVLVLGAGLLASVVAPYSYSHYDVQPDQLSIGPTLRGAHLFGTDGVGHDILTQTLYGIRTTVVIGLLVGLGATAIGVVVGAVAGFYGRWIDGALTVIVDFVVTVPAVGLLFAGIVILSRQPRPHWVTEVLILYLWTPMARVVRAAFVSLREAEFVEAARAEGASDLRIVVRHLLPSASASVLVTATGLVGQAMLLEATVEFFGYGFDPWVTPSLGALISTGVGLQGLENNSAPSSSTFALLFSNWWLWAFPALALVLVLVCVNFLGDSLDEALNPTVQS